MNEILGRVPQSAETSRSSVAAQKLTKKPPAAPFISFFFQFYKILLNL